MQIALLFIIFTSILMVNIEKVESFKILVSVSNYFHSHMKLHIDIADLLAENGHEVTLLIMNSNPYNNYPPTNNTNWTKSQNVIRQSAKGEYLQKLKDSFDRSPFYDSHVWTEELEIFSEKNELFVKELFFVGCIAFYEDKELLASLKSQNFDLGITEWHDGCMFSMFNHLGIHATVATSPIPMDLVQAKILGIPMPLYIPEVNTAPPEGTSMGIWDRARTLYNRIENKAEKFFSMDDWCKKIFGQNLIPKNELLLKSAFFLINTHEMLDLAKPISAKIKHIGGFTLQKNTQKIQLDSKTEFLLTSSSKGAILVSFGSVADPSQMPKEMFNNLMNAFASFPEYNFILKSNDYGEKLIKNESRISLNKNEYNLPENVYKFGWVKQRDILAHPKTRLFISHCGLNSLNEAAFEGVPLLCIPIFGDQNYNSAIVNQRKIGKVLLKNQLNEENLKQFLSELLEEENNEYTQNAIIVSQKMQMAPFQPKEILLRHVEFAAQFGGNFSELNLEGAKMSNFKYFGLDILFCLVIFGIVVFIVGFNIFRFLFNNFVILINFKKNKIE
ncbi:unnamed protein product [Meloidogyne enterolobii]|uniref:Uncharacterized protein n=1 Tax=Meloidogyne enterolobii TaxID=390850 RepID=A0ACB0YCQ9_MELEN